MKLEAAARLHASSVTLLKKRLEEICGDPTVQALFQAEHDPDLDLIVAKGRDYRSVGTFIKMAAGDCHWNVSKLFMDAGVDAIVIGYAHNRQGWHQHTWGLRSGSLVETTFDNRRNDHWFGYKLTSRQAKAFANNCAEHPPGHGYIRTRKGGSLADLLKRTDPR